MTTGIIGLGNMAKAMIGGMLAEGIVRQEDMIGSAASGETMAHVEEQFGIRTISSNAAVADSSDTLILAVKPGVMPVVLEEIRDHVRPDTLLISVAAGKTLQWIGSFFDHPVKIIRFMPNTPALVGEGCTAICRNENVTAEDLQRACRIAESFGMAEIVSEPMLDVAGAVAGSSPAYVFMFIEALADAAVKGGMTRQQSYRFAAQAVMGSAKLMLETGRHPGELKDTVCSPGGTTIEGLQILEKEGMRAAVMEAIEACLEKTKKL